MSVNNKNEAIITLNVNKTVAFLCTGGPLGALPAGLTMNISKHIDQLLFEKYDKDKVGPLTV